MTPPPLFTDAEYSDWERRPCLDEAWERLPVVRKIAGFEIRYIGPLIELGYDEWMGDLSAGAYGHLLQPVYWYPPWTRFIPEVPMLDRTGRVRADWSRGFRRAVEHLVRAAEEAGEETNPDRWASWLCFELHEPGALIRAEAERRGWDS